ncbi:MAG: N-acetyltransferase [Bacteroidota bacterium]|nr:N-acetyltransferase [Bacteroidota bacterium]
MSTIEDSIATDIIAKAFLHYPLMQYAFEGFTEDKRGVFLQRLYNKCVTAARMYGGVLLTSDRQGAVIWLRGKNFPLGLPREIRSGMATIPFQIGIKPTLRLMNHDSVPENWIRQNAGPNMGYIWCIGVLPHARGKGYSRLLIDESMEQMRKLGLTECWLKTEDPKNVTIYQKLGFKIMQETIVKSSGITSWALMKNTESPF